MAQSSIPVTSGSGNTVDFYNTSGNHLRQAVVIGDPATDANTATVTAANALKVDGSGVTQPVSGTVTITPSGTQTVTGTVTANAGTNLNTSLLALETGGNLAKLPLAQGSTTSGQAGPLAQGAVTTVAPTYTTAQTSPLSLTTAGALRTDASAVTQPVSGTFWQATQPVSAASLPLPSGASTAAKQPALGTAGTASSDVLTVQGIASMTALKVDGSGVTQPVSGTVTTTPPSNASTNVAQVAGTTTDTNSGVKSAGTLRVVIATDQPALTNKLLVTPDSVALPANQSVNVSQVNAHTFLEGGTNGSTAVGGTAATNVAITANPINLGAQAVSSENTAVTTARQVQLVADLVGKLIVLPYANPENFVSGAITSAMTGTTSTSLIPAPAAGLRNYITQITVSNSHATVGTDVIIQDGNGGTTLYTIPAAAAYGGATITLPVPLRQPSTATAIYCANVTTGSNTKVSASGYKGA